MPDRLSSIIGALFHTKAVCRAGCDQGTCLNAPGTCTCNSGWTSGASGLCDIGMTFLDIGCLSSQPFVRQDVEMAPVNEAQEHAHAILGGQGVYVTEVGSGTVLSFNTTQPSAVLGA
jgi:hypothetical protein